jgi:hypothetical protein
VRIPEAGPSVKVARALLSMFVPAGVAAQDGAAERRRMIKNTTDKKKEKTGAVSAHGRSPAVPLSLLIEAQARSATYVRKRLIMIFDTLGFLFYYLGLFLSPS